MKKTNNIMLFEEFCDFIINEDIYRFDNNRVINRIEQLCLKLGIDCRIVEYNFKNRSFKYNEKVYVPTTFQDFIKYLSDKTFIFYPEYNLFVDIMNSEGSVPKWILNEIEVRQNGMTTDQVESYIRKYIAGTYYGKTGKPIYVA